MTADPSFKNDFEITLRKAAASDCEALAELDRRCFSVPWSKESFEADLKDNPRAVYLVCERRGKIIAYGGFWTVIDEAEIMNIAVDPAWRRQGLASCLLHELIKLAEAQNLVKMSLEVRSGNLPARRLYESFGFVKAGLRRNYYPDNQEDAIIMLKTIS